MFSLNRDLYPNESDWMFRFGLRLSINVHFNDKKVLLSLTHFQGSQHHILIYFRGLATTRIDFRNVLVEIAVGIINVYCIARNDYSRFVVNQFVDSSKPVAHFLSSYGVTKAGCRF